MKHATEWVKEIAEMNGFAGELAPQMNANDVAEIQADALLHSADKIRNSAPASQQWMATDLEAEAEQLTA